MTRLFESKKVCATMFVLFALSVMLNSLAGGSLPSFGGSPTSPALVPDARATNIFALVNAMGRRDRARSLEILDTLTREGEYLPLALAFLSAQDNAAEQQAIRMTRWERLAQVLIGSNEFMYVD